MVTMLFVAILLLASALALVCRRYCALRDERDRVARERDAFDRRVTKLLEDNLTLRWILKRCLRDVQPSAEGVRRG